MTGRRRRLEQALNELDTQSISIEQCVERYAADDPELASMLRLAATIHIAPPLDDLQAMRMRVETALLAGMDGLYAGNGEPPEPGRPAWLSLFHAGKSGYTRSVARRARMGLAAAAVLLVLVAVGWAVSMMAQGTLPESPLYAVKRGEEWMALHVAWSDPVRGEVLAAVAARRLTEARAEAALHHDAQMRTLIDELDADMGQLIALTANMAAHHENTTAVANALARDLNDEYSAMQAAQRTGQILLAQALAGSMQAQQAEILHDKLNLPPNWSNAAHGNDHATAPDSNSNPHGGSGAGKSTPTSPGQGSGGNGSGHGRGHGGGRGGGDSSGGSGDRGTNASPQVARAAGAAESMKVPVGRDHAVAAPTAKNK